MRGTALVVALGWLAGCSSAPSTDPPGYQQLGGEMHNGIWWLPAEALQLRKAGEAWGAPRWFNETLALRMEDAGSESDQSVRVETGPPILALEARLAPTDALARYRVAWLAKPSSDPYFLDPAATELATDEAFAFDGPAVGKWTLKMYLLEDGQTVARMDRAFGSSTALVIQGAAFPGDPGGGEGYDDVVVRLPKEAYSLTAETRLRSGELWQQGTDIDLRLLGKSALNHHCSRRGPVPYVLTLVV